MTWVWQKVTRGDARSLDDLVALLNKRLLLLTHELAPKVATMRSGDTTPSVKDVTVLQTAGTTAVTGFDDGYPGQTITVVSKSALPFDTTSSSLNGSSVDITTASGDVTVWTTEDGTTWRLVAFVDASADNSGGA